MNINIHQAPRPTGLVPVGRADQAIRLARRALAGQAAAGHYENTRSMLASSPQLFWRYWKGQAAMPAVANREIRRSSTLMSLIRYHAGM